MAQEFESLIRDALVGGLRHEAFSARNREFLFQCEGARPTEYALAAHVPVTNPLAAAMTGASLTVSWPYPQLHRGKSLSLLLAETKLYHATESSWTLTEKVVYDILSAAAPSTETLQNGAFGAGTGWTNSGTWAISGGKLTGTNDSGNVTQVYADQASGIVVGNVYRVRVVTDSVTSGSFVVKIGTTSTPAIDEAGTMEFDLLVTSGTSVVIDGTAFTGVIDSVSVKKIDTFSIPSGGGAWQIMDFRDVVFAFKENCLLVRVPYYVNHYKADGTQEWGWVGIKNTASYGDFACVTGAALGSRGVLLGLSGDFVEDATFAEIFRTWVEYNSNDVVTWQDVEMSSQMAMILTPTGGDVFWPFVVELGMLGFPFRNTASDLATIKANAVDYVKKNAITFVPFPWQKAPKMAKRLGASIMCYFADGVSALRQTENGSWGQMEVLDIGVLSRCAIGGNERIHWFLDVNGVLWSIDSELKLERHGHSEYFASMVSGESSHPVVITYDTENNEAHIATDQKCLVRTRTGLGESGVFPTSLAQSDEGLIGITTGSEQPWSIITDTMDMQLRTLKTIQCIELGATDITGLKVRVHYKYDSTTTWRTTGWFLANTEGIVTPMITATDFRIEVYGTPGSEAKLDYMVSRWKVSDKRNIRGTFATDTTG